MGKEFDIAPRDVRPVETKYRRIATPLPHPDSLPTLEKLRQFEPQSIRGQPPIVWERAEDIFVYDKYVASTHPLYRGVAPGAPLILSANSQEFIDAKLIRAAEWGIASGGAVTNMSWGTICGGTQDLQSRWVDWATKNLFHTFVIAAGNHPAGCANATNDAKVASPALAWSVIAVGSENDNNTGFWTGDTMSSFSDWRNPDFATSMQKPEVTAVGENVMTTDNAGGDWLTPAPGVNGTSFASPMVAGQVALLVARQPHQMF